jgi:signal transduction histidine kinase
MEELRVALRTQAMQLSESRRTGSLAEMAAGVAHDFSNILTVMIGVAELIAENPTCPSEVAAFARQITAAGQRGVALAKELLGLARPSPRSSRVVRPAEVITSQLLVLQAAAGERHPINLEVRSAAERVLIDPHQLERVVLNLVVNARDAMPDGGPIGVLVDAVVERDEDGRPGQYVLIAVSDCGTGIPPAVLARIFDPFFTTKPRGQGTGVGLAVVSQVVHYAGGFVRVETAVGQGSTFRVYLPWVSSS